MKCGSNRIFVLGGTAIFLCLSVLSVHLNADQMNRPGGSPSTPTFIEFARPLDEDSEGKSAAISADYNMERLLAGHLLRRAGFGPTFKDLKRLTKKGMEGRLAWIQQQLNPGSINDSKLENMLPPIRRNYGDYDYIRRWYIRMVFSNRQLQEKMTLIWHEHFSVSDAKLGAPELMGEHEDLMRGYSLGNFRDFLIAMTIDSAMLIWLDNNYNNGNAATPPNENYAREFLQLFVTGTNLLNIDGTPILDEFGNPIPAYGEPDVRELARSLTGWYVDFCPTYPDDCGPSGFADFLHDAEAKWVLGAEIPAGLQQNEVEYAVDHVLAQRTDTVAAFIAKTLLQKLVNEQPSPGYVQRVAEIFRDSGWDIKEAVRAVLTDPEFEDPANIRTMYKEPIEQYVGSIRALFGKTKGDELVNWTFEGGQLIYYPPSVFSFYRPGNKSALVNTARVFFRDKMADEYSTGWYNTFFKPTKLRKKGKINSPDKAVDFLSDTLLASPLQDELRTVFINYMNGEISDEKIRGVVWLVMSSPDFQKN